MEEERVTYTELRVQSPLQQHRSPAASRAKGTACFEHRGFSAPLSPWKLIAVVLCLICLGLLFSVGILAAKLAERNSRNLIFSQETDQKGISQPSSKVWKCQPCGDGWQQHGKHCYSFSREQIPWSSCELHCSPLRSSFLKISTEGEMEFVKRMSKKQCFLYEDKFGFSLYYNSSQMKWAWLDGSAFILDKYNPVWTTVERNIDIGQLGSFLNEVLHYAKIDEMLESKSSADSLCSQLERCQNSFPSIRHRISHFTTHNTIKCVEYNVD